MLKISSSKVSCLLAYSFFQHNFLNFSTSKRNADKQCISRPMHLITQCILYVHFTTNGPQRLKQVMFLSKFPNGTESISRCVSRWTCYLPQSPQRHFVKAQENSDESIFKTWQISCSYFMFLIMINEIGLNNNILINLIMYIPPF